MSALQQAQADGLCLRYPEPLGQHPQVSYENAVAMLLRAIHLASNTPFSWGYIDKPSGACSDVFLPSLAHALPEGHLFLIFQMPQMPQFPPDGIVYQDREQRLMMIAGNGKVRVLCPVPQYVCSRRLPHRSLK